MNSRSILHNYDNAQLYTPDFQFIQQALAFKQNKIDVNKQKIYNLYDQMAMLKVDKDVDQEYINQRLEQAKALTNRYASGDLSDDNFASSIMANIGQIVDGKVKNAVLSTRLREAEDKVWKDVQEKSLDKYSVNNHRYAIAKSDRAAYLASQEAGALYKGGAGFIEYRDLGKKLMDNIDKIQSRAKLKWIETGPQQGYFRSIDTYEAVSKEKVAAELDFLFDEKDQQQLQINAWSTYDDKTDDQIKQDWDAYYQPKIDETTKQIKNLEIAKVELKAPADIEAANQRISELKEVRDKLESYNYDEVVKTGGRENVYTRLYEARYKENLLNAYSTPPTLIDRKVDEVQKENILFQQKLVEFDYQREQDALTNRRADARLLMEAERLEIERQKAGISSTSTATGQTTSKGVSLGGLETLAPKDEISSSIEENQKAEREAIEGLKGLTGSYVSKDDFGDLRKQLADLPSKLASGGIIKINGKDIKITNETLPILEKFKNEVLTESAAEKSIKTKLDNTAYVTTANLRQLAQAYKRDPKSVDMNPYELPVFNFEVQVDPKTKKQKFVPITKKGIHNYVALLQKDKDDLTESQKATLATYVRMHMIGDTDLPLGEGTRKEMYKVLRDRTLSNMDAKEFSKIGRSEQGVVELVRGGLGTTENKYSAGFNDRLANLGLQRGGATGQGLVVIPARLSGDVSRLANYYREYTKTKDKTTLDRIRALEQTIKQKNAVRVESGGVGTDTYLSELTARDVEYTRGGKEVSLTDFSQIVKSAVDSLSDEKKALSAQLSSMSVRTMNVSKEAPSYQNLRNLLVENAQVPAGYNNVITVKHKVGEDGKLVEGQYEIVGYTTNKGETTPKKITVGAEDLTNAGFSLPKPQRPAYSAAYGDDSPAFNYGRGVNRFNPDSALNTNVDLMLKAAQDSGVAPKVKSILNEYYNGQVTFNLEPINGTYYNVARDSKGEVIGSPIPTDISEISYEDLPVLYSNADETTSNILYESLRTMINQETYKSKVSEQQQNILNKIR